MVLCPKRGTELTGRPTSAKDGVVRDVRCLSGASGG